MLLTNFIEIAKNAMNELAEVSRNIGLLEQSIHMTSSPSQADAADYMISEETGRKRQIVNHLRELLQESHERSSEVYALYKSANEEESYYTERVKHLQAARDFANADICIELKTKASIEGTRYLQEYSKLNELALSISNTIRGEQSPRLLPLTTTDDLPFESVPVWRNPSATRISQFEFSKAVNGLLQKEEVLSSIEQYCQLDAAQLADNLRENSPTYKNHVKAALESAIYDNAQDEQTADALTDAVNVYFDSVIDDVQEALEEFAAPLPTAKSKRIDANFGYCR